MQLFTNVIASGIVVCATIHECVVFLATLNGLTPPRRGSTHEEKAGGTPDNGG